MVLESVCARFIVKVHEHIFRCECIASQAHSIIGFKGSAQALKCKFNLRILEFKSISFLHGPRLVGVLYTQALQDLGIY